MNQMQPNSMQPTMMQQNAMQQNTMQYQQQMPQVGGYGSPAGASFRPNMTPGTLPMQSFNQGAFAAQPQGPGMMGNAYQYPNNASNMPQQPPQPGQQSFGYNPYQTGAQQYQNQQYRQ